MKIIDFWAPWCGPCRAMAPVIDEIESEQNIEIMKVNIDDDRELAQQYGIRSIPTLLILENDEVKYRLVGVQTKDDILKCLQET